MKIECPGQVIYIRRGKSPLARVQIMGPTYGPDEVEVYFSVPEAEAPAPGQAVTVTIEWAAPGEAPHG